MLPTVLVINDFQGTLNLYADLLESEEYELELSNYEFEEPEMIERLKPTLIVLDFQVDQHNRIKGWQLLDQIKLNQKLASLPTVLCTPSMTDVREQEQYLQEQGVIIFYKPFKLEKFVQKVQQLLELSASETK
jgi:CheY-like chemotaxis protein